MRHVDRRGSFRPAGHAGATDDSSRGRELVFNVFAWLWALAVVMDQAKWSRFRDGPAEWGLTVAALLVLLWPRSRGLFLALLSLHLAAVWSSMPWVSNHRLLAGLVELTILAGGAWAVLHARRLGRRLCGGAWLTGFAPLVRSEVILFYLLTAWHKLNVDWFDPAVSCGATLYRALTDGWPAFFTGEWALHGAIHGALLVEVAIPLLLLVRRLRPVGLLLGVVFHVLLGMASFFNFSAFMVALLFLFVPGNAGDLLLSWVKRSRLRPALAYLSGPAGRRLRGMVAAGVLCALAVGLLTAPWTPRQRWSFVEADLYLGPWPLTYYLVLSGWLAITAASVMILCGALRAGDPRWRSFGETFQPPHWVFVIFPFLVLLNGMSPYLGLKTEGSFSMFSNLSTEGGASNHLLVRRPLQIADYQVDLVTILESSDPGLQQLADGDLRLPAFEIAWYLADRREQGVSGSRLRYERGGVVRQVEDAEAAPELATPPSFWSRKLLRFRSVRPPGEAPCAH